MAPYRQFPLLAGINLVGRDPGAQVWLDSPGVSRQHARITVEDNVVTLQDLNSKNGTRVRGQVVRSIALTDGDEVTVGSVSLTFRVWTSDMATATERHQ